jgi:hypothetical protein
MNLPRDRSFYRTDKPSNCARKALKTAVLSVNRLEQPTRGPVGAFCHAHVLQTRVRKTEVSGLNRIEAAGCKIFGRLRRA